MKALDRIRARRAIERLGSSPYPLSATVHAPWLQPQTPKDHVEEVRAVAIETYTRPSAFARFFGE